jgi:hypothetical protein
LKPLEALIAVLALPPRPHTARREAPRVSTQHDVRRRGSAHSTT